MNIRAPRKKTKGKKQRKRKRTVYRKRQVVKKAPQLPVDAIPAIADTAMDYERVQPESHPQENFQAGYDKGYQDGKYAGGEQMIDELLPPHMIFPDLSLKQIIATGVSMYHEHAVSLLIAEQVRDHILHALDERKPLSIVRLGDGELLTLAQETVMPVDVVRREGKFLEYAGVKVPDLDIRNRLAEAVAKADIVGIPRTRMPNYQLLVSPVFRAYGISFQERQWTDSLINYSLCQSGCLLPVLRNRKVLLIGNMAEPLAAVLAQHGISLAGMVAPVNGARDADRVIMIARQYDFDIALVSAGIAAVIITEELARATGKVAVDFGHMANALVKGDAVIH
ncbi:GT-D fold domain-containing protein [Paenibacillus glycanilyticus]|uniref:GT-D fold-like domain-containing protein n=1 Tax=Paenibacillus glycanilyticus TaxID=126569 RepID=A0ABQ6GQA5_9BACL|nr:GT-D fold domain-containing glycosyltransferase [Paenibacillus glycanilyticus]GLX71212.1 hypothetical protein MU1_55610 [Paenibacillus glycanilyticus]